MMTSPWVVFSSLNAIELTLLIELTAVRDAI